MQYCVIIDPAIRRYGAHFSFSNHNSNSKISTWILGTGLANTFWRVEAKHTYSSELYLFCSHPSSSSHTYLIMACDISSIWAGTARPLGAGSESKITWAQGCFHIWNKQTSLTHCGTDKMHFQMHLVNGNMRITIPISLKFVSKGSINNKPSWFRQWLGDKQATSHYLNQWWSNLLMHICITLPQATSHYRLGN